MNHFQDLHPYDSAILGLNNLYIVDYKGDFYIQASFIMATEKKLRIGTTYLLVDNHSGTRVKMTKVRLIDCYFDEGVINLVLQDISTLRTFTIDQQLECKEIDCTWILVDFNYFIDKMNANAIRKYCEKCHDSIGNSIEDNKSKQKQDDGLLEFEF
jgi:hypothetical protein